MISGGPLRVGLDRCRGSLGNEVPQGAGRRALLAEAREDVGDVGQVGLVRTDELHAAPAVTEAGVGVQKVGGAVQGDDGLARTRAAVDDKSAAGSSADDGVLVGRMVPSTSRIRGDRLLPRLAMKADWSSSAACPSARPR